MEKGGQKG